MQICSLTDWLAVFVRVAMQIGTHADGHAYSNWVPSCCCCCCCWYGWFIDSSSVSRPSLLLLLLFFSSCFSLPLSCRPFFLFLFSRAPARSWLLHMKCGQIGQLVCVCFLSISTWAISGANLLLLHSRFACLLFSFFCSRCCYPV